MIDQTLLLPDLQRAPEESDHAQASGQIRVGAWMTAPAQTIAPTAPVLDAYDQMIKAGIRRLPVVAEGQLVGIVTLGDLREARPARAIRLSIYELNGLLARLTVEEVMTHDPYTVTPDMPARDAAAIMLTHKVGAVPVVDVTGQLVGIITESDLFRLLIRYSDYLVEPLGPASPTS